MAKRDFSQHFTYYFTSVQSLQDYNNVYFNFVLIIKWPLKSCMRFWLFYHYLQNYKNIPESDRYRVVSN